MSASAVPTSARTGLAAQTETLPEFYRRVRSATVALAAGLAPEDTAVQSMPDASPTKWHLAHTTWFFEQFVLGRDERYQPLHASWKFLFNSYYYTVGSMWTRSRRGLLTRPTLSEILDYRRRIDERMQALLGRSVDPALAALVKLGLNHEQQHQELLLTDLKHLFSLSPLNPVYRPAVAAQPHRAPLLRFLDGAEGEIEIGHAGGGFAFDCEAPRHRQLLYPHAIANRLVTNGEFLEFIRAGGYGEPTLWLSDGWALAQREAWQHPLYWSDGLDSEFSLSGQVALDPDAPICHLSYFEAEAFARWAGARLPSEAEWESLAAAEPIAGNFVDEGLLRTRVATSGEGPLQLFGDVWEWTQSPYAAYPRYRAPPGALGEYNGKFMCGQFVLRGGSFGTPADHMRATYRNFWAPATRWQFSGLRLAKDR